MKTLQYGILEYDHVFIEQFADKFGLNYVDAESVLKISILNCKATNKEEFLKYFFYTLAGNHSFMKSKVMRYMNLDKYIYDIFVGRVDPHYRGMYVDGHYYLIAIPDFISEKYKI